MLYETRDRDTATRFVLLGREQLRRAQVRAASKSFQAALQADVEDVRAYAGIATCLTQQRGRDSAVRFLLNAAEKMSRFPALSMALYCTATDLSRAQAGVRRPD